MPSPGRHPTHARPLQASLETSSTNCVKLLRALYGAHGPGGPPLRETLWGPRLAWVACVANFSGWARISARAPTHVLVPVVCCCVRRRAGGLAQRSPCWAHSPQGRGSKPRPATLSRHCKKASLSSEPWEGWRSGQGSVGGVWPVWPGELSRSLQALPGSRRLSRPRRSERNSIFSGGNPKYSGARFQSTDLWVMSPTR